MYFYSLYNQQFRLLFGANVITPIVNDFESRVISDGGVFESPACLAATLTKLNNIA
jgi:hypothetical protein